MAELLAGMEMRSDSYPGPDLCPEGWVIASVSISFHQDELTSLFKLILPLAKHPVGVGCWVCVCVRCSPCPGASGSFGNKVQETGTRLILHRARLSTVACVRKDLGCVFDGD